MPKPRICRGCTILLPIDSSLQYKRKDGSIKDGAICKYCWKDFKTSSNKKAYANGAFDYRLKEPTKKVCSECKNSFHSTIVHKVTCSEVCSKKRHNRTNNKKRNAVSKFAQVA